MSPGALAETAGSVTPATARTLIGVLALAVCAGGIAWWWHTLDWPVEKVRIETPLVHADRERLGRIVAQHTRAGFFGLDLAALKQDLLALPWLRRVSVRRVWPHTLRVDVREHAPVAVFNHDALVGRDGTVFRPSTFDRDGLVRLQGPRDHGGALLQRLRRFQERVAPVDLEIKQLHEDDRRAWRLTLANGIAVRLGRKRIARRLARFVAVWPKVLQGRARRIEAIDLRYTNGFAVVTGDGERLDARKGGA